MAFTDHAYLPFLAIVVALLPFVPARLRPAFLLAASYVFYCTWSVPHGLLLLAITAVDFGVGRAVGRARAAGRERGRRRLLLALGVGLNVGALVVFKYSGFALENLNAVLRAWGAGEVAVPDLLLPLGISFYTFQGVSYLLDVHHGHVEAIDDPVELALYIALFPQLVAGPIERAGHLVPQLRRLVPLTPANLSLGARRILWGLGKKQVLADPLLRAVWPVYTAPAEHDSVSLFLAAAGLNAVLYLDFSAYTDIARGSARLFGVELVRNFDRPFVARTASELMRRWHMSLSTWIRDYLLLPLGRGMPTHGAVWRNNLLVLGLFGLWHGAAWTYLVCGLAIGVVLSFEVSLRLAATRAGRRRARVTSVGWSAGDLARWTGLQVFAAVFFALFFAPDLGAAADWLDGVLAGRLPGREALGSFVLPVATCFAVALAVHVSAEEHRLARLWDRVGTVGRALWFAVLVLAVVLLRDPDVEPFLYFRF